MFYSSLWMLRVMHVESVWERACLAKIQQIQSKASGRSTTANVTHSLLTEQFQLLNFLGDRNSLVDDSRPGGRMRFLIRDGKRKERSGDFFLPDPHQSFRRCREGCMHMDTHVRTCVCVCVVGPPRVGRFTTIAFAAAAAAVAATAVGQELLCAFAAHAINDDDTEKQERDFPTLGRSPPWVVDSPAVAAAAGRRWIPRIPAAVGGASEVQPVRPSVRPSVRRCMHFYLPFFHCEASKRQHDEPSILKGESRRRSPPKKQTDGAARMPKKEERTRHLITTIHPSIHPPAACCCCCCCCCSAVRPTGAGRPTHHHHHHHHHRPGHRRRDGFLSAVVVLAVMRGEARASASEPRPAAAAAAAAAFGATRSEEGSASAGGRTGMDGAWRRRWRRQWLQLHTPANCALSVHMYTRTHTHKGGKRERRAG